jgi:class 3 adenylate cyclase
MASDQTKRKLAAVLIADVAGYSRLMGVDDEGTLARLKLLRRELIEPKNKQHRGRIVARQSGWEHSDNQDGNFGGRGERMIVAARR